MNLSKRWGRRRASFEMQTNMGTLAVGEDGHQTALARLLCPESLRPSEEKAASSRHSVEEVASSSRTGVLQSTSPVIR